MPHITLRVSNPILILCARTPNSTLGAIMRNALLIIALLATACSKKEAPSAPSGTTTQGTAKPPAANTEDIESKFGGACATASDCPTVEMGSTCSVECVKAPEAAEGYCQLRRTVTIAGQTCWGNYDGVTSQGIPPADGG